MSGKRVPTTGDLSTLSRDEWEALCHDLCAIVYDTERVEDRLGRGNGLDAFRESTNGGGVEGWQFRRFDDRLENKQIQKLKDAVNRAVTTCKGELDAPLKEFTVFGNIDLQPGHGKAKGEGRRFREFREWCLAEHTVSAVYRGVTWVRSRLLKFPHVRPDLFEDLPAAIQAAKEEIIKGQAAMLRALQDLKDLSKGQLAVLASEASLHFERGQEKGRKEEFRLAIQSLRDAERLARAPGVRADLLVRIQAALAGVLYVSGFLRDAITTGRQAVAGAEGLDDEQGLRLAMGNLALALSDDQEYAEARSLFLRVLKMDEEAAELGELVRTLANLLSVDVRLKDWERAAVWAHRLEPKIDELDAQIGPSRTSINAVGNLGTFHLDAALHLPAHLQPPAFQLAVNIFSTMVTACREVDLQRSAVLAEANLARALWFLNRYQESNDAFDRAVAASDEELGKVAADCRFNQAMMLNEFDRVQSAVVMAEDALRRYKALRDDNSALDAKRLLERLIRRLKAESKQIK